MELSKQDARRKSWRPSPALAIALLALFVGLGGTASALSGKFSVKKGDIAPNAVRTYTIGAKQVRSGKIAPGQIDPYKLNLGGTAPVGAEASTTSTVPVDLGGPNASVKAPPGSMIQVHVSAAMRSTGNNTASVYLVEPSLLPSPQKVLSSTSTANFQTKYSAPGTGASGADEGVSNISRSGWITIPAGAGGVKTFTLRYDTTGGTSIFKDRKLTLTVIQ